tara:strand:+ start:591 stop:791 length:201 start_codon:yes stop_codon:yes gene_type:complete
MLRTGLILAKQLELERITDACMELPLMVYDNMMDGNTQYIDDEEATPESPRGNERHDQTNMMLLYR